MAEVAPDTGVGLTGREAGQAEGACGHVVQEQPEGSQDARTLEPRWHRRGGRRGWGWVDSVTQGHGNEEDEDSGDPGKM